MPLQKITVAVINGTAVLSSSPKQIVENSGHLKLVGLWTSGGEVLKKVGILRPQVMLVDIALPDISGIELTARIKQLLPEIQIIMVLATLDHNKVFAALRAGASGYILQRSSTAEVHSAITDVLMSAEIARRLANPFHRPAPERANDCDLTKRETEVMERLSEGLGNNEIAICLGLSIETVRVHLRRIYKKIDVNTRTQALVKYRNLLESDNCVR